MLKDFWDLLLGSNVKWNEEAFWVTVAKNLWHIGSLKVALLSNFHTMYTKLFFFVNSDLFFYNCIQLAPADYFEPSKRIGVFIYL